MQQGAAIPTLPTAPQPPSPLNPDHYDQEQAEPCRELPVGVVACEQTAKMIKSVKRNFPTRV